MVFMKENTEKLGEVMQTNERKIIIVGLGAKLNLFHEPYWEQIGIYYYCFLWWPLGTASDSSTKCDV